jgi:microcystin-dependent protein
MEGYLGEIRGFAGNFAPRAWALCQGQLLSISQNQALFSILGTTYGGDGRTTFALPDLRGRAPLQQGIGPGLSTVNLGQRGGGEYTQLTSQQLPSHSHTAAMHVVKEQGNKPSPQGKVLAADSSGNSIYSTSTPDDTLSSSAITVGNTGSGVPVQIRNPYLGINMIICMQGLYPSRG